jgi:hypothetical protein
MTITPSHVGEPECNGVKVFSETERVIALTRVPGTGSGTQTDKEADEVPAPSLARV